MLIKTVNEEKMIKILESVNVNVVKEIYASLFVDKSGNNLPLFIIEIGYTIYKTYLELEVYIPSLNYALRRLENKGVKFLDVANET